MNSFKIQVKALWFQPEVGAEGYYGAILADGTPVGLCSAEKWNLGRRDSLRSGWNGNLRVGAKTFQYSYSESQLKADGLFRGTRLELAVPEGINDLCK